MFNKKKSNKLATFISFSSSIITLPFYIRLREIADEYNVVLIADEVITGFRYSRIPKIDM